MISSGALHERTQAEGPESGQGYVHRALTRRERVAAEVHATIGVAVLLGIAVGAVRLVPHIGRTAPGSAWLSLALLAVYPTLRGIDSLATRCGRGASPARAAVRTCLALALTTPLLLLYLSNLFGAAVACLLALAASFWLVRNTPEAML